jgi:uncharacterized damage-inducible protein DinB
MNIEELKYPIGKFTKSEVVTPEILANCIAVLEQFPDKIRLETENLSDEQLDTCYRDGGWTVRQVVTHLADSHINSYIRLKLAITENKPTIKPFNENDWANLTDNTIMPIEPALKIIEGIHQKWVYLLKSLSVEQLSELTFIHPQRGREMNLMENVELYSWHCSHHLAHITNLKERMGWK